MQSTDKIGAKSQILERSAWVAPQVVRLTATEAELNLVGGPDLERTS